MIRAVIDTNVLISSVIGQGSPRQVVIEGRRGAFEPVCSPYIINEFRLVMQAKFHLEVEQVEKIAFAIARSSVVVPVFEASQQWCSDPADDAVVETAIMGMATHIVTGDRRLSATAIDLIEFIDPTAFLRLITS